MDTSLENQLIQSAVALTAVPLSAKNEYSAKSVELVHYVNRAMESEANIDGLLGKNPVDTMRMNHANHAQFMVNVFELGDFSMLGQTVVWVYRAYCNRGFSPDYFPTHLAHWLRALELHLQPENAAAIKPVYQWIIDNHQNIVELSRLPVASDPKSEKSREEKIRDWSAMLVAGDRKQAMEFALEQCHSTEDYRQFLLEIIQPAMERIGRLWEEGKISVAQEHLASAIVRRVMTNLYSRIPIPAETSKKVVVTSAPGEQHDLGALMVSDLLELEGYDSRYLGANTPEADLVQMMSEERPEYVLVSVSMAYNLGRVKALIQAIRDDRSLIQPRVLVGGHAFNWGEDTVWRHLGADGYARSADKAVELIQSLEKKESA